MKEESKITIDPNANVWVENFKAMPNLRWVEREVVINDVHNVAKTVKVLQQLHLGDRGTQRWEDVPTETEGE
jgi:hypothetical protein